MKKQDKEKRINVLAYDAFRAGETEYIALLRKFGDGCAKIISKELKISGIAMFNPGFRPVAIRTTEPKKFVICDHLQLSYLAYAEMKSLMRKDGILEDSILMDVRPAIIFLKATFNEDWDHIPHGDYKKLKKEVWEQLNAAREKITVDESHRTRHRYTPKRSNNYGQSGPYEDYEGFPV